jgi:AraC-like DNA-binding protein
MTYALDTGIVHSDHTAGQFAAHLFDALPRTTGCLPPRTLARVKDYIEAHLDSALTMIELAQIAGLSISHFARCFRRSVGLPPHTYVKQRRVARARDMLAATDLPVAEIALVLGFSDQSHFTRRFREVMGVPPGAYRFQCR